MLTFVSMGDRNYNSRFQVLYSSIKNWHPHSHIIYYTWGNNEIKLPVEVRRLEDKDKIYALARGDIITQCLEQHDKILFIGSDTEIFRHLNEAEAILDQYDFAICPHICQPLPDDEKDPSEARILISGYCNADFQLWRRSDNTNKILDWYRARLKKHGHKQDTCNGYLNEQTWLTQIPYLFDNALAWRQKTYNVAYWNCCLYNLCLSEGVWITDGGPLALFHYSGFDPHQPHKMSIHQNRWHATGALLTFFEDYARKILT